MIPGLETTRAKAWWAFETCIAVLVGIAARLYGYDLWETFVFIGCTMLITLGIWETWLKPDRERRYDK